MVHKWQAFVSSSNSPSASLPHCVSASSTPAGVGAFVEGTLRIELFVPPEPSRVGCAVGAHQAQHGPPVTPAGTFPSCRRTGPGSGTEVRPAVSTWARWGSSLAVLSCV